MLSKYVFGPAPSRRFGRSLGVNPLPRKTCNYSCVYCQLGRTPKLQARRIAPYPTEEVVGDAVKAIGEIGDGIDYITFMGDGEPTLAANLGEMAGGVRKAWDGGMALITNGSLFHLPEVRRDAMPFDVISPTVSAGDERTYRRLHRPARSLTLDKVLGGLKELRAEFEGEIWAELMLVQGINDSLESLLAIRKAVREIGADRLYICVPHRPPSESWVLPPAKDDLERAFEVFPEAIDMTAPEEGPFLRDEGQRQEEIIEVAKNHPLREDQAHAMLSMAMGEEKAWECLREMVEAGRLSRKVYSGTVYYSVPIE